jgi:ribonuclease HI
LKKSKFYAVREGKNKGIYRSWDECKEQVHGFKKAEYKSFKTLLEAESYMSGKKSINEIYGNEIDKELRNKETVLAYVDGSFSVSLNKYSFGCVILENDKETEFYGLGTDNELVLMRNVAGELLGSMEAIKWAVKNNYKKIIIHYDYTGIEYWAKGEWKTNKKGTSDYKKFIDAMKEKIDIEFIKIEAHTGDIYNEKADKLAKKAIEEYETIE